MIIKYEIIRFSTKISKYCKICKKRINKTITEEQTVNPFNRHADGIRKTKDEIVKCVEADLTNSVNEFKNNPICKDCFGKTNN